jgi:hypothetical protein
MRLISQKQCNEFPTDIYQLYEGLNLSPTLYEPVKNTIYTSFQPTAP